VTFLGVVWPGFIVAGVVLAGSLVFHLASTPYHLMREEREEHRKAVWELGTTHSETQAALAQQQADHVATREALVAARMQPVDNQHRRRLQRITGSVRDSINHSFACAYEDPEAVGSKDDPKFKESLHAHCPEVIEPLSRWDAAVDAVNSATSEWLSGIKAAVDEAGMADLPWALDGVADAAWAFLLPRLNVPSEWMPEAIKSQTESGLFEHDGLIIWRQFAIRDLTGLSDPEKDEVRRSVERLLLTVLELPQAQALRDCHEKKEKARRPALQVLADVSNRNTIPRRDGCWEC